MKNRRSWAWLLVIPFGLPLALSVTTGCTRAGGASAADPKTDDDKALYAWGLMLGRNASALAPSPAELELIKAGLTDSVQKNKPKVDIDKYGPMIDAVARKRANVRAEAEKGKTALDQARRAGRLPLGRRHQVLDRGRRAHEGRREGDADLPVRAGVRRPGAAARDPGRRDAHLRRRAPRRHEGRADRDDGAAASERAACAEKRQQEVAPAAFALLYSTRRTALTGGAHSSS